MDLSEHNLSQTVPANFDLINFAVQETECEFMKRYGDLRRTAHIMVWQDGDFQVTVQHGSLHTRKQCWYNKGKIQHWEGEYGTDLS